MKGDDECVRSGGFAIGFGGGDFRSDWNADLEKDCLEDACWMLFGRAVDNFDLGKLLTIKEDLRLDLDFENLTSLADFCVWNYLDLTFVGDLWAFRHNLFHQRVVRREVEKKIAPAGLPPSPPRVSFLF